MYFVFHVKSPNIRSPSFFEPGSLTKVGQFPSLADLSGGKFEAYSKILGGDWSSELTRAVGLAAHGVGIGAFVYLRRVFEALLEKHRQAHEGGGKIIRGYDKMHMNDKIAALKKTLPPLLVSNRSIYGILSKGIHELDEQTCLANFPLVRDAIMLILQQEAEKRNREQTEKQLTDSIAKLAGSMKDRATPRQPT